MRIALVAAMAKNRTIGKDNQLPWHLPEDLIFFKSLTLGSPVLMGRKTWESIGRVLPGRLNIVVTRQPTLSIDPNLRFVGSLESGIKLCQELEFNKIYVIGGEQIYQEALPLATDLYLTEINANIDGDARFPKFDTTDYQIISQTGSNETSLSPLRWNRIHYARNT